MKLFFGSLLLELASLGMALPMRGQAIAQFPVSYEILGGIAAGPDGNVWYTEFSTSPTPPHNPSSAAIGRITPSGVVTHFPIPVGTAVDIGNPAVGIAAGPDGNLWITRQRANTIGRLATDGVLTEFAIPTPASLPGDITAGPDGNLWFVELGTGKIGRITTAGIVTEFSIPVAGALPSDIAAGPDGNLWFTDNGSNGVGRITTSGQVTVFALPTADAIPNAIAAGPDGNLWFVETQGINIGRMTPAGVITEFPVPSSAAHPMSIAAGPDGNLWFTGLNNSVARITTSGVITVYPLPTPFAQGVHVAAGPDGSVWLTQTQGDFGTSAAIARVTPEPCGSPTTICLNAGRFLAQALWEGTAPVPPPATGVRMTDATGYFWFYDPKNVEVVVKVIDGCATNHHYWVFAAGLTNVLVHLSVQDATTGKVQSYTNPPGTPFQPIQDTAAFPCP